MIGCRVGRHCGGARAPAILVVLALAHGSPAATLAQPASADSMSAEAAAYLAEALRLMRENSINRESVDWAAVEREAFAQARSAREPRETHEAIREALVALDDRHSFLITSDEEPGATPGRSVFEPVLAGEVLDGRWAYLSIPMLGANSSADTIRTLISRLDGHGPCGWIVDLRRNLGGNMWPMLLGLGPLLGAGRVGSFVDPAGTIQYWMLEGDRVGIDSMTILGGLEPLELRDPGPPVAVLTGPHTVSSGEAVAVAFRARPRTRSFGMPTAGLSTANYPFPLPDGSQLNLTISTFADRSGRIYGGPIDVDVRVEGLSDYAVISEAIDWLSDEVGQECMTSGENSERAGSPGRPVRPVSVTGTGDLSPRATGSPGRSGPPGGPASSTPLPRGRAAPPPP